MDKKILSILRNQDITKCKSKYRFLLGEDNKPLPLVSNIGLKKYHKAYIYRNGEYHKFCIETQEDIKPLITEHHIYRALKYIDTNIEKSAIILNIDNYYQRYGDTIVYYTVDYWLRKNNFNCIFADKIGNDILTNDLTDINRFIDRQRHHPLDKKIKIVDIGINTKTKESVVPSEWLNREFKNGFELHCEMDKLPSRKGKSPVSYCCIYSMTVKTENTWINDQQLNNGDIIYDVSYNKQIYTNIIINKNKYISKSKLLKLQDNIYVKIDGKLLANKHDIKTLSVGYLSSLLQKCIRRGYQNKTLLHSTINKLNKSPTYNLPDHNFALVSGTRQLLWRSYISIIEESIGYMTDKQSNNQIDMLSLIIIAIVCNIDPKIRLSDLGMSVMNNTLGLILQLPDMWKWQDYKEVDDKTLENTVISNDNQINSSIYLALKYMPMMRNDRKMLKKAYSFVNDNKLTTLNNIQKLEYFNDKNEILQTRCVAMDMHCNPSMLIQIQGMLYFKKFDITIPTLQQIAHYIWNNFSRINFRHSAKHILVYSGTDIKKNKFDNKYIKYLDNQIYDSIAYLQENLILGRSRRIINWLYTQKRQTEKSTKKDSYNVGRTAWLLIFGKSYRQKYKNRMYDIILAGCNQDNLCRVKRNVKGVSEYVEGKLRKDIQEYFISNFKKEKVKLPSPPDGYKWKYKKTSVTISYDNDVFCVDNKRVKCLNLLSEVEKIESIVEYKFGIPQELIDIIKTATYSLTDIDADIFGEDIIFRLHDISYFRREFNDYRVFNWKEYGKNMNKHIWLLIVSRIYMSDIDGINGKFSLSIGPCDRNGKKTNNSINYRYEGVMYRIYHLLEALYPFVLVKRGNMRWTVDKTVPEYYHMIKTIQSFIKSGQKYRYHKKNVLVKTILWEHQEKTITKMFSGMVYDGKRGFGDASHVGAGKTLCALGLMSKLYRHNYNKKKQHRYGGFLVLVPSIPLIKTWTDEIGKHCSGFDVYTQLSNGMLCKDDIKYKTISINSNTIIISTMGRMRDKPIKHQWILVVIDECLSVQNKEALQTEEAWRQSCYSKYGIVMLSATFFRSRFDKMLYMIKMLKVGLPEERIYLDTILSESIVSNITKTDRVWTITTSKIDLDNKTRVGYNDVYKVNSKKSSEYLYIALSKYINDKIDYIKLFYDEIDKLTEDKKRTIIFTKSKKEADNIVMNNRNNNRITRYPEKGQHTVLSYTEGTYGLNDLVIYDTILMRPPEPDKLPQIKGRLDRPGQINKNLSIRYILLKDTIEEAGLIRMEICMSFRNNYLMPLSEFYDIAINK